MCQVQIEVPASVPPEVVLRSAMVDFTDEAPSQVCRVSLTLVAEALQLLSEAREMVTDATWTVRAAAALTGLALVVFDQVPL